MTGNRRTRVRFPVLGYEVRVIQARDVARTCRRLGSNLTGACAAYVIGDGCGWIVFGANPDEGTIAHEASHAVRAMLEWVGATLDDETFAYHLDYLVGKIHKFLGGKRAI